MAASNPKCTHCDMKIHGDEGTWIDKDGFMACDPRRTNFSHYTHAPETNEDA